MANATTKIVIEHVDQIQDITSNGKGPMLAKLGNFLTGIASGANGRGVALELWKNTTAPVKAFGTMTVSSGDTGTYTTTINGVGIDATGGASDVLTGTAIAAAINASTDALVQYIVEACNFRGSYALSSVAAGQTVQIRETSTDRMWEFTAVSGTPKANEFDISGNDSADATSLAAQINATPILNHYVYAYTSTSTCYVHQRRGTAATIVLQKNGAGITRGANAASAVVGISALHPSVVGNCVTTVATAGTGYTAGAARLVGGTGGNAAATRYDL